MLMRFDPFRDMDRLLDQVAGGRGPRSFPMDAYRRGNEVTMHLDLPGMDADSIDLTVERNVLTIRAERRFAREDGDEIIVQERPQGTFTRQIFLGDTLDAEHLSASYDQGVLTIAIPVAEHAQPRRFQIGVSRGEPRTIEGTAAGGQGERFERSEQSTGTQSQGG